ncbi:MAG: pyridoxal phosphate-dependent aminotransferase [Bacteroidales bacterium]|jgi:aspartate aminotransferase|nr:pyridoxal phosphate-dependent aminotransferase [Bacteroidales bacterium]MDD4383931.1 pyridoxal phosphate-dependent aminotransferase [Bacteroidales bacterium]MDY0196337.1 pyridoxal phosphate-dependent aminotransferase [Tenuifilaceae bacterium]
MENVSNRVNQLAASETLAMSQKSRELKALGHNVINLSVGEPDFHTPDFVKDAAKKAITDNITFYSPVPGFPELLEAISKKLKRENNLIYSTDQIVVSGGAKHTLSNVLMTLINPGDEVIIPAPYWVSYVELVKLVEGKSVVISTSLESDFKISPKQLENAITPKTKVLMICSPSNPTGSIYTKQELKAFADVLEKHPNIYIISDEIYEHINYIGKHESIAQFESIADRVIVVNGVSKGYAMTGWRIGYCAAPKWITKACQKLQGQMTSGTCSIAQKAAIAAINSDASYPKMMREAFMKRRDVVIERLKKIPGFKTNVPEGAFYIFTEVSHFMGKKHGEKVIENSADLCMYLLNNAFVATVPGSAFGAENYIRFSYAASEAELLDALNRIEKAVADLR